MPDLQPGDPQRLGSYELVRRLGEGGQGVVFLGVDPDGTHVAVKLLRPDLTEDESARSRFVREFQSAMRVKQFCTAQVLEADVAGDRPYIVSEYIPGPSLYRQVMDEGPRQGAALERLAIGTITALVAIHKADIVHRDFKPHNVLMGPDGPRVIDFGIARALDVATTMSTQAIGTPAYMAPEQVMGQPLTNAVDIFAWASVMVFAATAKPPFGQDTIPAVINRVLHQTPDLSGVSDEFRELLTDCLAKEPERRPKAAEVLMRLLGQEPVTTAPAAYDARLEPMPATRIQPASDFDFNSEELRRIAAGAGLASAAGALAEADTEVGTYGAASGSTIPQHQGPPPPSAWNTSAPPPRGRDNRMVAIVAAAAAILLAAIVGLSVWALTSNNSNTGSNINNGSTSPSTTDSGSGPQSQQQTPDQTSPTDQQQNQPPPRHSHTPSSAPSQTPTSQPTNSSPSTQPTDGGGSPTGGPTHGGGGGSTGGPQAGGSPGPRQS